MRISSKCKNTQRKKWRWAEIGGPSACPTSLMIYSSPKTTLIYHSVQRFIIDAFEFFDNILIIVTRLWLGFGTYSCIRLDVIYIWMIVKLRNIILTSNIQIYIQIKYQNLDFLKCSSSLIKSMKGYKLTKIWLNLKRNK